MDRVVDLVSVTHNLRKAKQIRVRQPLAELIVATADAKTREALKRFEQDILEELNIKQLTFIDDVSDLGTYSVKPNFKVLGPKLGPAIKEVAAALAGMDHKELAQQAASQNSVSVTANDQAYELNAEELDIRFEAGSHVEVQETADMIVALNTELTDELTAEGMVRDVVRHIQVLRKDQGLELEDRIVLSYATENSFLAEAMSSWKDYVTSETLAIELKQDISGDPQKSVTTGDAEIALHVEKIS